MLRLLSWLIVGTLALGALTYQASLLEDAFDCWGTEQC